MAPSKTLPQAFLWPMVLGLDGLLTIFATSNSTHWSFSKNTIAGSTAQLERSANEKDMLLFGSLHHEQQGYSRSASITRTYPTRTVIHKNDLLLATILLEMASRKLLPNGSLASAFVRIKRIPYQRLERDTNALTPRWINSVIYTYQPIKNRDIVLIILATKTQYHHHFPLKPSILFNPGYRWSSYAIPESQHV